VVTDVTGATASKEVILTEPEPITPTITIDAPASTNGTDGKATVKAVGGDGKYKYAWDNGEKTASTKMLAPGLHTVTVTDKNGCSATANIEIPENILPLAVQIEGDTKLFCYGQENASLKAIVQGGKGPFSFTWNTGATSDAINQLGGGSYTVEVNDAAGNTINGSIEIVEPMELKLMVEVLSPANTDSADGRAKGIVEGGTGAYQYAWDNGETASEAIALAPGVRTLVVTDEAGCSAKASVEIKEEVLELSAAINVVSSISCHDAQDGSVNVVVSGGKKPFDFVWEGKSENGTILSGLGEENLQLTVTDATGQQTIVTYDFEAPDQLKATIASKKPCRTERIRDGKATLAVSGGTAPYTYLWSNEETTQTAEKLSFGMNTVTITDARGCSTTAEVDIVNKILPDLTAGMIKSGQTIKIEKLQFEADSSAMMDSSFPVLNEIFEFLEDNPFIVVEIGGHTNGLPEHEFCDRLSTARAKTVADYMIAKGINQKRVIFKGYGKRQPIATNQTPEGRRRNQRVEVKILEIEEGSGG
jgi:outer membrane protein OmpA-like peptidoglycan-associated protein